MIDLNLAPAGAPQADTGGASVDFDRRLATLRAELQRRAPALVREIFPAAHILGHDARIGDLTGAPGESLSIELAGEKAGLWKDHATGESGDLIDLWRETQGYKGHGGFMEAVSDLEQHLGMSNRPAWAGPVARVAAERAKAPKPEEITKTLEETSVYHDADGREVARVLRYRTSDGKKTFRQQRRVGDVWEWKSPEVRPLFQVYELASEATVILVEGEKCVRALRAIGIPATTAMGGADAILEKADWEPLRGRQVILWPDNDEPGRKLMERVQTVLLGIDCDVRMMALPANLPPKYDAADMIPELGDRLAVLGFVDQACGGLEQKNQAKAPDRSIRILDLEELEAAPAPEWLIDGVLVENSFACLVAPPAAFKSFVAIDWAMSVATGRAWFGREVRQGPVVYVAGEGAPGLVTRVLGWKVHHGVTGRTAFKVVPAAVGIPTVSQVDELLAAIRAMPEPPVMIVLDTVARNFGGADENKTTDMNAFIEGCDRLRMETGACVVAVHHTGKDVERGMRGSSALLGALDTLVVIKRKGPCVTLINKAPLGKQKEAEEFEDVRLIRRVVSVERHGEETTTLVLELDESPIAEEDNPDAGPKERQLGGTQKAVLQAILDAGERGIGLVALRGLLGKGDNSAVSKALEALKAKGKITFIENGNAKMWFAA